MPPAESEPLLAAAVAAILAVAVAAARRSSSSAIASAATRSVATAFLAVLRNFIGFARFGADTAGPPSSIALRGVNSCAAPTRCAKFTVTAKLVNKVQTDSRTFSVPVVVGQLPAVEKPAAAAMGANSGGVAVEASKAVETTK